jgi:hypothetical protein
MCDFMPISSLSETEQNKLFSDMVAIVELYLSLELVSTRDGFHIDEFDGKAYSELYVRKEFAKIIHYLNCEELSRATRLQYCQQYIDELFKSSERTFDSDLINMVQNISKSGRKPKWKKQQLDDLLTSFKLTDSDHFILFIGILHKLMHRSISSESSPYSVASLSIKAPKEDESRSACIPISSDSGLTLFKEIGHARTMSSGTYTPVI